MDIKHKKLLFSQIYAHLIYFSILYKVVLFTIPYAVEISFWNSIIIITLKFNEYISVHFKNIYNEQQFLSKITLKEELFDKQWQIIKRYIIN